MKKGILTIIGIITLGVAFSSFMPAPAAEHVCLNEIATGWEWGQINWGVCKYNGVIEGEVQSCNINGTGGCDNYDCDEEWPGCVYLAYAEPEYE